MSLSTKVNVTLADGRPFTYRTRTDAPNLERDATGGKGKAKRQGAWWSGYLAACAAGAGNVGDRYLRCMLSGVMFDAWHGGDVDRLDSERGYVMGNVILVSARANWGRGYAQKIRGDIVGIERYAAHVHNATKNLPHVSPTSCQINEIFNAFGSRAERNAKQSEDLTERAKAMLEVQEYVLKHY